MEFEYQGKFWTRKGFRFQSLAEYIRQTRQKLSQPLSVPPYATAGEEKRIRKLSEKTAQNPYLNRAAVNEQIRRNNQAFSEVRSISYDAHPVLYEVCMLATRTLMDTDPLISMYTTDHPGLQYNAFATDYQDKVWIYVSSQFFREHGMLTEEEMCFLVGHELGHAQCHHSTLSVNVADTSDDEYSADRAGMIACGRWILTHEPGCTPDRAARQALLCGAAVLEKLNVGLANGPDNTDWTAFPYDKISQSVDMAFEGASSLALSDGTHPHDRHRVMAMVHFSQSQLFYRCLGLDPTGYRDLLSDAQLRRAMASQLTFATQEG